MDLDDLIEEFRKHPTIREGVRHIVLALRDEILDENGMQKVWLCELFNDILGDAGNEKAGGPTSNAGLVVEQSVATSDHGSTTPAAAPSPQCEWMVDGQNLWLVNCKSLVSFRTFSKSPTNCPSCGKPIIFKEPSHD